MASEKSDIELDDDFVETEGDVEAADVPVSKTNLTKRPFYFVRETQG